MPKLTIEQLTARHAGIGSSDVPELLAISPYEGASPIRLFMEKTAPIVSAKCDACVGSGKLSSGGGDSRTCAVCKGTGAAEEDDDEAMELGHLMEPVLLDYYSRKRDVEIEPGGTVYSTQLPWAFATVDAHARARMTGLEVKFVGAGMTRHWDRFLVDGVPQYVRAQNAWQMFCTGYDRIVTIALLGGPSGFAVFEVDRDPELEGLIVSAAATFWDNVQRKIAPPLDDSDAAREYLNAKYPPLPADVEVTVDDPEIIAKGIDHCTAKNVIDDSTSRRKILGHEIIAWMGERGATVATCDDWKAIYRPNRNGARSLLLTARGELRATGTIARLHPPSDIEDGDAF